MSWCKKFSEVQSDMLVESVIEMEKPLNFIIEYFCIKIVYFNILSFQILHNSLSPLFFSIHKFKIKIMFKNMFI